jgi:hypothetical protein
VQAWQDQPTAVGTKRVRCAFCAHPVVLEYRPPERVESPSRQVWKCPRWRCMKPNALNLAGRLLTCKSERGPVRIVAS